MDGSLGPLRLVLTVLAMIAMGAAAGNTGGFLFTVIGGQLEGRQRVTDWLAWTYTNGWPGG